MNLALRSTGVLSQRDVGKSLDAGEDFIGRLHPRKRPWILVVGNLPILGNLNHGWQVPRILRAPTLGMGHWSCA
jgi:hypothetical protein